MDSGPLWSQDPLGNYWLLFPNKHALVKQEIKDIFSEFGKVRLITESGDEKGLRFVQYSCLDDVENAIENLKDHPTIKLIPCRPKNNKTNQNNNATKEESTDTDPEKRNFFQRKPPGNQNRWNGYERKPSNDSNIDFQNVEYDSNFDKASICSSSSRMNCNGFSTDNNFNDKSYHTTSCVTSPTNSLRSAADPVKKVKILLQTRGVNSSTFSTGTMNSSSNISCDYQDELPDLVASNKVKSQAMLRKRIYTADEVIVANIPEEYGSAYILHLLEKFEPLAISYIKIARKNEIRYCHVYFKSVEDSMGAETMFDKYDLCGKKLVVLRSCNLEEEVTN